MKFRTDYVTNSSSSSSIIISFEKGAKIKQFLSINQEYLVDSLAESSKSYQGIIERLADFKMIEIICDKDVPHSWDSWLVSIAGTGDVYLPIDKISEFKDKNPSSWLVPILNKLLEIEKAKEVKVKNYKEFVNHPLWNLMGVLESSKITKIFEDFDQKGDYCERKVAEIDITNLKIKWNVISSDDMDIDQEEEEY